MELDNRKLKAADLCKVLDIPTSLTSGWKKRNCDPPARYVAQIADFLGMDVYEFLTGEPEPEKGVEITQFEKKLLAVYRASSIQEQIEICNCAGIVHPAVNSNSQKTAVS